MGSGNIESSQEKGGPPPESFIKLDGYYKRLCASQGDQLIEQLQCQCSCIYCDHITVQKTQYITTPLLISKLSFLQPEKMTLEISPYGSVQFKLKIRQALGCWLSRTRLNPVCFLFYRVIGPQSWGSSPGNNILLILISNNF